MHSTHARLDRLDKSGVSSLVCLEFKIGVDPQDNSSLLRKVNQQQYFTTFIFKLDGNVHGKSLTSKDKGFELEVSGKDIASGLMARVENLREEMA